MNDHDTSIREALEAWQSAGLRALHVAMPARVVAYHHETASADVRPVHRIVVRRGDTTEEIEPPVIYRCPVQALHFGPFIVSAPLAVDDEVVLLFADREIETWLYSGGTTTPATPRAHHLTDALVLPGFASFKRAVGGRSSTDLVIGLDSGAAEVRVTPAGAVTVKGAAGVNLGDPATASAVLGEALVAWLDSHIHTSAAPGTPTTPPVVPASAASMLSATVRVSP